MKIQFATALLAIGTAFAQEKAPDIKPEPKDSAIITVKTLSGDAFDRLVKLLDVFNERIVADNQLRTIVVYAPKDVIAQVKRVVQQLDQPGSEAAIGRNIEMTLTFLRCSIKPSGSEPVPADMESVARQLRATTQYKGVEVWDVLPLHLQEGRDTLETFLLPSEDTSQRATTAAVSVHPDGVGAKNQQRYVRFSRLNIDIKFVAGGAFQTMTLNTAGDFTEGQKSVLGKISGPQHETAVFVVITLKVLD